MTASFRMNHDLKLLLDNAARISGKRKSDIMREAVEAYCAQLIGHGEKSWCDVLMDSGLNH